MDPMTIAMLLSGVLSAGGNIFGGLLAGSGNPGPTQNQLKDLPTTANVPSANPAYNALMMNILAGLGLPIDQLVNQASPITGLSNQLANGVGNVSQANAAALNDAMRQIQGILSGTPDPRQGRPLPEGFDPATASSAEIAALVTGTLPHQSIAQLQRALSLSGFQNIEQLIDAERTYRTNAQQIQQQLGGTSQNIADARSSAAATLQRQIADFPTATQEDINRLSAVERQRMNEEVLQASNVAGVNPSAGLAEVARDVNPIARAIALLGGGQQLAQNALNASSGVYYGPVELATAGVSPILSAAQGNQSVAAQQAAALLNNTRSNDSSAVGTGVAAGAGAFGNAISTMALLDMLQNSRSRGAGTATSFIDPISGLNLGSW